MKLRTMKTALSGVEFDQIRTAKGRQIASTRGAVKQVSDDAFTVRSQTGPGSFRVTIGADGVECSCPDWTKRHLPCKHAASVRFYLEKQTTLLSGEVLSERLPLTYPQAWRAYDQAQTEEVRLFDVLLADLTATVEEPPYVTGRPPIPLRDGVFCAVQKVYSQLSCRRARSLFGFAAERGQLARAPAYVVSSRILNRVDVTPVLHDLIAKSALPLAALEKGFAPDSTGIRTTSFGGWLGERHGDTREHRWLKAHALAGVKTHVIAKVVVTEKNSADNIQFEPLVRGAHEDGFGLAEVYADKAYSARANYSLAEEIGFDLYVPFKSNATMRASSRGRGAGEPHSILWRKAFLFFQLNREEFYAKYHQRSNVEAVFSALKRKFGETLRSRTAVGQVNELLAKVLAYNITVLIHEIFEHGVVPDFLREPALSRVDRGRLAN
jgi:transposase